MECEILDEAFDERAAIREFDGGFPRTQAEQLAKQDLENRLPEIDQVVAERDEVGRKYRAEQDEEQKEKLFRRWMDLNMKILDLKKELTK